MDEQCGSRHPDSPEVICGWKKTDRHSDCWDPNTDLWWPNPDFVEADTKAVGSTMKGIALDVHRRAADIRNSAVLTPSDQRRIARGQDPWTSHVAARRIVPRSGSRRAAVLALLQEHPGEWIPGYAIASPEVGGTEGLRRLRELREQGWAIERIPDPQSKTAWLYRLAIEAPVANP